MFWRKKMEARFKDQDERIRDLEAIVQDLCPHKNVYIHTSSFFDGHSIYYVKCQKCEKIIDIVDKTKSIEIIKEQELRQARELIAKSEINEQKENINE